MMNLELSNQLLTRTMQSVSRAMAEATVSDAINQTQDGGRCSDTKMVTLSTRKERSWMSTRVLIWRTDKSLYGTRPMDSTNNGILFTLTNKSQSQPRDK